MEFALEKDLVEQFVRDLPKHLRRTPERVTARREFNVGRSIADIVVFISGKQDRLQLIRPLNVRQSVVLSQLRAHSGNQMLIEKCVHSGRDLKQLVDCGLVKMDNDRLFLANRFCGKIIAFEAKLERWRDALAQAVNYQRFSDESYVILPSAAATQALASKGDFIECGVGLIAFDGVKARKLLEASKSMLHDWAREFVFSRLVSQHRKAC